MVLIYIVVYVNLLILAGISTLALATFPVFEMVFQLMFPIFFIGSLAFMLSTIIRNGNGTAVVMVIIGLAFWIASGILETSKFNLFLNPFSLPDDMNEIVWVNMILSNRIIIFVASVVSILWGLLNLQKREKFV